MSTLPLVKWDGRVNRKFPDMKIDGVANILSDSMVDSGVEAPLSTDLDYSAALAFHQLMNTYAVYAGYHHKDWTNLKDSKRKLRVPDLILSSPQHGVLHHLITTGGLIVPPKWTVDIQTNMNGSFSSEKTAYIELVVIFLPILDYQPIAHVGRPKKHCPGSQVVTYRLLKSPGPAAKASFTLSVKGSGLFLLQGNADYALPAKLKTKGPPEDTATELQMFVGAMKSPFALLQSLAQTCLNLKMSERGEVNQRIENIVPFLEQLPNDKIRVRGFTFTRYMDFQKLGLKNVGIRQDFLRSLFLIYEAAKGNRRSFTNNGMKTYKGITAETRFEDEDLQKTLDADYMAFAKRHSDAPNKVFLKKAKSVSNVYSVRLTKSVLKQGTNVSNHLTTLQFTVPKTLDRTKLGLDPSGARYLRDHCLKIRFSVFNKFLLDYKIHHLGELIQYLCPDHKLDTFRANLDKLFHRVLEGYDYFYWVGRKWENVVTPFMCCLWTDEIKRDIPLHVWELLRMWASEETASDPGAHTLTNLVLKQYWPDARDPDTGMIDRDILKAAEKKGQKIAKIILAKYGINIRYPRAFHITVADAFFCSTLHNLQSLQGVLDLTTRQRDKLRVRAERLLDRLSVLHRPRSWNALAMTMRKRHTTLIL